MASWVAPEWRSQDTVDPLQNLPFLSNEQARRIFSSAGHCPVPIKHDLAFAHLLYHLIQNDYC
jgi:hypothetical protein